MTTVDGRWSCWSPPAVASWIRIDGSSALEGRFRVVGIREPGHYGTEPRPRSVVEASAVCSGALRPPVSVPRRRSSVSAQGGVLAHQLAFDISRDGVTPDVVVLLDTPIPGADGDREPGDRLNRTVSTVRRRGRNALALARMHVEWKWYRFHPRPARPALAKSMTLHANARRVRNARHVLRRARALCAGDRRDRLHRDARCARVLAALAGQTSTATALGSHTGAESFLSRANAAFPSGVILDVLDSTQEAPDR